MWSFSVRCTLYAALNSDVAALTSAYPVFLLQSNRAAAIWVETRLHRVNTSAFVYQSYPERLYVDSQWFNAGMLLDYVS